MPDLPDENPPLPSSFRSLAVGFLEPEGYLERPVRPWISAESAPMGLRGSMRGRVGSGKEMEGEPPVSLGRLGLGGVDVAY